MSAQTLVFSGTLLTSSIGDTVDPHISEGVRTKLKYTMTRTESANTKMLTEYSCFHQFYHKSPQTKIPQTKIPDN